MRVLLLQAFAECGRGYSKHLFQGHCCCWVLKVICWMIGAELPQSMLWSWVVYIYACSCVDFGFPLLLYTCTYLKELVGLRIWRPSVCWYCVLFTNNTIVPLILFLPDMEMVAVQEQQMSVAQWHLVLVAWCLVTRMLDVVAEFTLKRVWRADLIQSWKEAFGIFQRVNEGLLQQQNLALPHIRMKIIFQLCLVDIRVSL